MTIPPFPAAIHQADTAADGAPANGVAWHIVEAGDRWYQALLSLVEPGGPHFATVSRWTLETVSELIARLDPLGHRQAVVVWELPTRPASRLKVLEAIATVSQHSRRVVQAAYPPTASPTDFLMAAQELGIDILLHDLWSLRTIGYRLGQTGPPASN